MLLGRRYVARDEWLPIWRQYGIRWQRHAAGRPARYAEHDDDGAGGPERRWGLGRECRWRTVAGWDGEHGKLQLEPQFQDDSAPEHAAGFRERRTKSRKQLQPGSATHQQYDGLQRQQIPSRGHELVSFQSWNEHGPNWIHVWQHTHHPKWPGTHSKSTAIRQ